MPHIIELSSTMAHAFVSGDVDRGNKLLSQLIAMQSHDGPEALGHRGNFAFYPDHDKPTDLNALSFCGPYLAYVAMEHDASLTPPNRETLWARTLPECLIGYDNHYRVKSGGHPGAPLPRWWQCNIWFLNIGGRVMIARALGRNDHIAIAQEQLEQARRFVELYGIAEFNSPTYIVPQIEGMLWAWRYAPNDTFCRDAQALLDELYIDLAEHYHPASGVLGGTWSRHYETDLAGRGASAPFVDAAIGERPSFLESLGLEPYPCPAVVRQIFTTDQRYSVWRRGILDVRRMMYQTPEYSLATQSGSFIWKQQDTPVRLTYVPRDGARATALIRTPYWCMDVHAASDYAAGFERWAHQHENRAILSYQHTAGGNDLLFSLAHLGERTVELADAQGRPLSAPECEMMPAPLSTRPDREPSPHFAKAPDLRYVDPQTRRPPGDAVTGPIIVSFPSCYLAIIPEIGLSLHVSIMRDELQVAIPVRPTALLALFVLGRSECPSLGDFVKRLREVELDQVSTPSSANAARLRGLGPTLTASRDAQGRLSDRRIDDLPSESAQYWCYSPFHKRRSGDTLGLTHDVLTAREQYGVIPA